MSTLFSARRNTTITMAAAACLLALVGCSGATTSASGSVGGEASTSPAATESARAKPTPAAPLPLTVKQILGPVGTGESVVPKDSGKCSTEQIISPDGKKIQAVTLGHGITTVYFTAGGRTGGLPVAVTLCPVTEGADFLAQGYTYRNPYNTFTGDSSAAIVTFGAYQYSKQEDKFGGFGYTGFANGQFVQAGAGGAAPSAEAESIISEVLTRIP